MDLTDAILGFVLVVFILYISRPFIVDIVVGGADYIFDIADRLEAYVRNKRKEKGNE